MRKCFSKYGKIEGKSFFRTLKARGSEINVLKSSFGSPLSHKVNEVEEEFLLNFPPCLLAYSRQAHSEHVDNYV